MDHGLELINPILEILEIEVCNILHNPGNIGKRIFSIQSYPGNSGLCDPYISSILEMLDRTIHILVLSWKYWIVRSIYQSYVDVAGGRRGVAGGSPGGRRTATATATATAAAAATAAATSQQLSHLARPLDHHAQGPNTPFGVNPSLRCRYVELAGLVSSMLQKVHRPCGLYTCQDSRNWNCLVYGSKKVAKSFTYRRSKSNVYNENN